MGRDELMEIIDLSKGAKLNWVHTAIELALHGDDSRLEQALEIVEDLLDERVKS
jgi:hypothetical protein|tara:strand:- start:7011 stop:7172 length:162 start_codon:yes stop_codon:yes gene_type:complete